MKNISKKFFKVSWIALLMIATVLLLGCGDSEIAKEITNTAKKTVEGEVAKTKEEIKKQLDQVIKPGAGTGQKENEQSASKAGKNNSEKDSHENSSKEDDD